MISRFRRMRVCGLRAPELPIEVAPRIKKVKTFVGQGYRAVQMTGKSEGDILLLRMEVYCGYES
jgi:hypothetical protein